MPANYYITCDDKSVLPVAFNGANVARLVLEPNAPLALNTLMAAISTNLMEYLTPEQHRYFREHSSSPSRRRMARIRQLLQLDEGLKPLSPTHLATIRNLSEDIYNEVYATEIRLGYIKEWDRGMPTAVRDKIDALEEDNRRLRRALREVRDNAITALSRKKPTEEDAV